MVTIQVSLASDGSSRIDLHCYILKSLNTNSMNPSIQVKLSTEISATEADWSREKLRRWWDPSRQLLKSIRQYQKLRSRDGIFSKLFSPWAVIQYRFWSIVTASDIPINSQLGGGLLLTHPNGIVIHPDASIGPNCLILQQVTIVAGVKIGGHVDIGAGAKIIRPVTISDHAKIGANAVVICDVPAGATAVGIPARIIDNLDKTIKNLD